MDSSNIFVSFVLKPLIQHITRPSKYILSYNTILKILLIKDFFNGTNSGLGGGATTFVGCATFVGKAGPVLTRVVIKLGEFSREESSISTKKRIKLANSAQVLSVRSNVNFVSGSS